MMHEPATTDTIDRLLHGLHAALPAALVARSPAFADLPACGGAYALVLAMGSGATIRWRQRTLPVAPGLYVYAGSAYGPGGLRARLMRHARTDRLPEWRPHWHIDQLTSAASHLAALAIAGGQECAIIARLEALAGFHHPWPGFGSSDCRCCRSHLLRPDVTATACGGQGNRTAPR